MNIYIDESGSINNHSPNNRFFVIALVRVLDKDSLKRSYKRFVSANFLKLQELDKDKINPETGIIIKQGGKMFEKSGKFTELKGSQFDREMRRRFIEFFSQKNNYEIYYIKIDNSKLDNIFCENTARVFNYTLKLALEFFIAHGILPNEDCILQLDERNERTEAKYFLENYLNTELRMNGTTSGKFSVQYFDSANNNLIQIADVFANFYYSQLLTGMYDTEMEKLKTKGILKHIFKFPL